MIAVRLAIPADAPELARLNALFNGEGGNTPAAIARSLADGGQEIVCVADDGGHLVGFCCGQVFCSMCYARPQGEITELFVEGHARRAGIGGQLVGLMESALRARGVRECHLLTGEKNLAAQRFYRALGYERDDEMLFRKGL